MDYFDKYSERMRVRGPLDGSNQEDRMIVSLRNDWENNPSARRVCVTSAEGEVRQVRIQTTKKTVGTDKVYVHPDDNLNSGDVINALQDYSWLVLDTYLIGHIFKQANIVRINRVLKWIVEDIVYEQPIIAKNFSRVDGTDEDYFFHMPENVINVFLPLSSKTSTIKRDQRFMIDKIPYKVTRADNFTHTGVTILFVIEDIKNENDTDEIADYVTPVVPQEIYIDGKSEIIYGFSASYNLIVNEEPVSPTWSVSEIVDWFSFSVDEDTAKIEIAPDVQHIGKSLLLQAEYEGALYYKTILVRSFV